VLSKYRGGTQWHDVGCENTNSFSGNSGYACRFETTKTADEEVGQHDKNLTISKLENNCHSFFRSYIESGLRSKRK
jgi:hypothetical protein